MSCVVLRETPNASKCRSAFFVSGVYHCSKPRLNNVKTSSSTSITMPPKTAEGKHPDVIECPYCRRTFAPKPNPEPAEQPTKSPAKKPPKTDRYGPALSAKATERTFAALAKSIGQPARPSRYPNGPATRSSARLRAKGTGNPASTEPTVEPRIHSLKVIKAKDRIGIQRLSQEAYDTRDMGHVIRRRSPTSPKFT